MADASGQTDLGRSLAPLGVRYILLSKTWEEYSYIYDQSDLELVLEGDTVALFRNTHPVSLISLDDTASPTPLRFEESSRFGVPTFTLSVAHAGKGLYFVPPLLDPSNWRLNDVTALEPSLPVHFPSTTGVITYRAAPYLMVGRLMSFISLVIALAIFIRPVWLRDMATSMTVGCRRLYAQNEGVVKRGI